MDVWEKAAELAGRDTPFAMATIIESSGSTPRSSGKMIVLADGTVFGTVGGGLVERRTVEAARGALAEGRNAVLDFSLDSGGGPDSLDMDCGGAVKIFVEAVGVRPRLLVAGGGHVGLALASAAHALGWRVAVADDRPDYVTAERFPMAASLYVAGDMDAALALVRHEAGDRVVIATHAGDERTLRHFMGVDCAYLGMLGSRRKVAELFRRLAADGVPAGRLARVHAPIGLDLGAETPEEIAVSVLAEIMAAVNGTDARPFSGER